MATGRQSKAQLIGAGVAVGTLVAVTLVATAGAAESAAGATTSRVSVSSTGGQANGQSGEGQISASGRYVAFFSESTNLVQGDTNGVSDVFVRDRIAGTTRRVSVSSSGVQGNERSFSEAISGDGRYVVFTSAASNLVPGDTNGVTDLFVRDVQAGVTQRISVDSAEQQGNNDTINFAAAMSANGRYIAFTSTATNLVPDDTNGPFATDVFLRDRVAGTTLRVSVGAGGQQLEGDSFAAAVSADGRYVVFSSFASNAVPGDTNFSGDVFVRDVQTQTTRRVSVGPGGQQGDLNSFGEGISADGRFVLMGSAATNLVNGDTNGVADIFVRDRQAGVTRRVSLSTGGQQADDASFNATISADGRYVSIDSLASNLVPGDTNDRIDVFVRDRLADVTTRVSVSTRGTQAVRHSSAGRISADGRHVVFMSLASVFVPGDSNNVQDVFVRDEFGDLRTSHQVRGRGN